MKSKSFLLVLMVPWCASGAYAADTGLYFGGSIGQTTTKASADLDDGQGNSNTFRFDKENTGYKAFVGYNFLPWLGVEGGYVDLGSPSDHKDLPQLGSVNGKVDASGWEAFLVGTVPVGPVDLFAKVGGINADMNLKVHDQTFGISRSEDESNTMFAYGGGASYSFGKFAVRAEVEAYDVSKLDDLYMISAGLTYHL